MSERLMNENKEMLSRLKEEKIVGKLKRDEMRSRVSMLNSGNRIEMLRSMYGDYNIGIREFELNKVIVGKRWYNKSSRRK